MATPDRPPRLGRVAADAFRLPGRVSWRAQLRSAVLLGQIRTPGEPVPAFTFAEADVARANDLVRLAELERSPRERRADPGELPAVAQTYADLAYRLPPFDPQRASLLALAASTWSLAGYQANAAAMASEYLAEIDNVTGASPLAASDPLTAAPAAIAVLTAAVLRRDVAAVAQLGATAQEAVPVLGSRMAGLAPADAPADAEQADWAVLAGYGLAGEAARALARFWRTGDLAAGERAVAALRRAAGLMLGALVVDTWALLDNLAYVTEDAVATSPWRLLRRASNWNPVWARYLRVLAAAGHPVVQVWPSQRQVLDAGLLHRSRPALAVTMPTSAGKTNVAEWAILHALAAGRRADGTRPLAVYIVPTRALAAEVERHLSRTLGSAGFRVSSLFGGAEQVLYESRVVASVDVLVVTSEKFDLLLRNEETITTRLSLIVADEGHLIGESARGLRLEMVITRARRLIPTARVIVLSAVLPNGSDIAGWLDPPAAGRNLVTVEWTPSNLRVGVFTWRGADREGQHGEVRYRAADADHDYFLPYILTRHRKIKKLYPGDKKETAAELALHYEQIGPVLIAAPTRRSARAAANTVHAAARRQHITLGARDGGSVAPGVAVLRERIVSAVTEFAGASHELTELARAGIAYHHSDVPEPVRRAIEDAYCGGALRILCATSTLSQGVNLPAKTVIFSGTHRGRNDELPVRDFWNTAGRAARPFRETEGHVILIAASAAEARRLRAGYAENRDLEPVVSTLFRLYADLLTRRLGRLPQAGERIPAGMEFPDIADGQAGLWAEDLDLQLLTLLAEEVVETADEGVLLDAVSSALHATLGARQLEQAGGPLLPLARFAARRLRAVTARVPDSRLRAAFVRTGLSLAGGETALAAADVIAAAVAADADLLTGRWPELRDLILRQAVTVAEIIRSAQAIQAPTSAIPVLAADWIDGISVDELRLRHGTSIGETDPMKFAKALDRLVVNDLAWVCSAILLLISERLGEPLAGPVSALPAMLKFGVPSETACYAASVGARRRADAIAIASMVPAEAAEGFSQFCAWAAALDRATVTDAVGEETARLFLSHVAAHTTPEDAMDMLITGRGSLTVPLRGVRHAGSAALLAETVAGEHVALERDHENPFDSNAITVKIGGQHVGYIAREAARILSPLLDDDDAPSATGTVASLPPISDATRDGLARLEQHDAVRIRITLAPHRNESPG